MKRAEGCQLSPGQKPAGAADSSPARVLLYPRPVVGVQEYSREVFGVVDDQLRREQGTGGRTDGGDRFRVSGLYSLACTGKSLVCRKQRHFRLDVYEVSSKRRPFYGRLECILQKARRALRRGNRTEMERDGGGPTKKKGKRLREKRAHRRLRTDDRPVDTLALGVGEIYLTTSRKTLSSRFGIPTCCVHPKERQPTLRGERLFEKILPVAVREQPTLPSLHHALT